MHNANSRESEIFQPAKTTDKFDFRVAMYLVEFTRCNCLIFRYIPSSIPLSRHISPFHTTFSSILSWKWLRIQT